jgi:hypothetical protein
MKTSPHKRKAWMQSGWDLKTAHKESLLRHWQSSKRNHPHMGGLNKAALSWEAFRHGVRIVRSTENKCLDKKCDDEQVFTLVYSQSMVAVPDQEAAHPLWFNTPLTHLDLFTSPLEHKMLPHKSGQF